MHSVHTDKRLSENTKDPAERISLTFRLIGTFLTPQISPSPSGPAAGDKSKLNGSSSFLDWARWARDDAEARPVVLGSEEAERLLAAFGAAAENHQSEFDWEKAFTRRGVRCLHFTTNTPMSV